MASNDYLCFCGTEIINASRLAQMLASGRGPEGIICQGCAPCPDFDTALGYPGGYNPADNPWYDPEIPDSNDFAGLLVTSITGLQPGKITRSVTQLAGSGAAFGPPVQAAPQIVVTGLLLAATCCGMEYGFEWLRNALMGDCSSGNGCGGCDLTFLSCMPLFPDEDCTDDPNCVQNCLDARDDNPAADNCDTMCAGTPADFPALLAPYYRTFKNAALISGPDITAETPRGCPDCYDCGIYEVTFTLSATDPCVYQDPTTIAGPSPFSESPNCPTWIVNGTEAQCDASDTCVTPPNCATDPNCVDTAPPSMPTVATNACVQTCEQVIEWQVCTTVPPGTFPSDAEGTLQVSIFAGSLPLRNIRLQVWENPLGLSPDELEVCAVCSSIAISYVAADATLVIDGASRTALITCPGGTAVRANPYIANGQTGAANFGYPVFAGCGSAYTICVTASGPVAPDATVTIDGTARYC